MCFRITFLGCVFASCSIKKNWQPICVKPHIWPHICASHLVMFQAILDSQKTSIPGDLIAIPGATEKISLVNCSSLGTSMSWFLVFLSKNNYSASCRLSQSLLLSFLEGLTQNDGLCAWCEWMYTLGGSNLLSMHASSAAARLSCRVYNFFCAKQFISTASVFTVCVCLCDPYADNIHGIWCRTAYNSLFP